MKQQKSTKPAGADNDEHDFPDEAPPRDKRHDYNPSELVIKELMLQKSISYDEALYQLRNPAE